LIDRVNLLLLRIHLWWGLLLVLLGVLNILLRIF
jgi:hypothetical protein